MKRRIVVAGVLVGAATLLSPVLAYGQPAQPTTPTTTPTGGPSLTVTPAQAYPGQHVLLTQACPNLLDPASSSVLILGDSRAAAGTRYTDATINPHATPGWYVVTAVCDNTTRLAASILVLAPATPPGSQAGATNPAHGQVTQIPHGAPQTGDGSTANAGGSEE